MTVIFTLIGIVVFIVSLFTTGFKSGLKRLLMLIGTGFVVDVAIVVIATIVMHAAVS